jgi:hypothetical protein
MLVAANAGEEGNNIAKTFSGDEKGLSQEKGSKVPTWQLGRLDETAVLG